LLHDLFTTMPKHDRTTRRCRDRCLRLVPVANDWALRDDAVPAYRAVYGRRAPALRAAMHMARNENLPLVIHDRCGRARQRIQFSQRGRAAAPRSSASTRDSVGAAGDGKLERE
jgi:hypothetical protein